MIGVWVDQSPLIPNPGNEPCENDQNGWRISFDDDQGQRWSLTYRFARQKDAQMALEAMDKAGYTLRYLLDSDPEEEDHELDRVILGAMQW